jgi:hypothetical protein
MAVQFAQTSSSISWQLTQSNTPFLNTYQGPDSASANFAWTTGGTDVTAVLAKQYTIAPSGSQTINLLAQDNLLNTADVFARVYAIEVLPTGSNCVISPAADSPLIWFFGSATDTVTVKDGGLFLLSNTDGNSNPVSGGASKLTLTNPSATASLVVKLIIIGGI